MSSLKLPIAGKNSFETESYFDHVKKKISESKGNFRGCRSIFKSMRPLKRSFKTFLDPKLLMLQTGQEGCKMESPKEFSWKLTGFMGLFSYELIPSKPTNSVSSQKPIQSHLINSSTGKPTGKTSLLKAWKIGLPWSAPAFPRKNVLNLHAPFVANLSPMFYHPWSFPQLLKPLNKKSMEPEDDSPFAFARWGKLARGEFC